MEKGLVPGMIVPEVYDATPSDAFAVPECVMRFTFLRCFKKGKQNQATGEKNKGKSLKSA